MSRGIELGRGDEAFQRASDGLRRWRAHRLIGMRVFPDDAAPRVGETVLVTLGTRRVAVAAPCRIVAVTDEPTRFGFSYATLPGHPECGEESFIVHRDDSGRVVFRVTAISRPDDWATRLAGPAGRYAQSLATAGYLRALRGFVGAS